MSPDHFLRSTFRLMSGQNSAPRLAAKSNPSVMLPWSMPRRTVLRRSGYHSLDRNAAPYALPSRHVESVSPPESVRVRIVPRSACPTRRQPPAPER